MGQAAARRIARAAVRGGARLALLSGMAVTWAARAEEMARPAAKSGAQKLRELGLSGGVVEGPGIGRVLLAFVLVAALAWGAIWLLRRLGFLKGGLLAGGFLRGGRAVAGDAPPIRHLARGALPGGIACHVVQAQGRHVLITVTRQGVTSVVLGDAPPPAAGSAS